MELQIRLENSNKSYTGSGNTQKKFIKQDQVKYPYYIFKKQGNLGRAPTKTQMQAVQLSQEG